MAEDPQLIVLHDGSCPLCRREIALYRAADRAGAVDFRDVSRIDPGQAVCGLTREVAMARFHVVTADGRTLSGAAAFIALWRVLPGWRWLGRIAIVPGLPWLLERAYRAFLPVRPLLQRLAGGRLSR
jgi:predicted DCC family thiol-disulfide oxidoreductase YuxK